MTAIRVLNLNVSNFRNGGRSKIVYQWGMHLNQDKVIYDFFAPSKKFEGLIDDYLVNIEKKGGVFYSILDSKIKSDNIILRQFSYFITIRNILKENNYKIVHIHSSQGFEALKGVVICKICRVPVIIVHSHNAGMNKGSFYYLRRPLHSISKFFLNRFKIKQFACSSTASKWIFGHGNALVIKNGLDLTKFSYNQLTRDQFRKRHNIDNFFVIGCIGRFHYQKNHTFLLDIFSEVIKIRKGCRLLLVGEGELEYSIKKKVEKLKLEKYVIFLGHTNNIPEALLGMDAFVLTSRYEGLGIVNLEAQASGLPTILSDKIPHEVKCTELVEFISLSAPPLIWAKRILSYATGFNRGDRVQEVSSAGYNLRIVAQELEDLYTDYVNQIY